MAQHLLSGKVKLCIHILVQLILEYGPGDVISDEANGNMKGITLKLCHVQYFFHDNGSYIYHSINVYSPQKYIPSKTSKHSLGHHPMGCGFVTLLFIL